MYPHRRRRPNKHIDTLAWEASWERDLKTFYDRPLQSLPLLTSNPPYPRSLSLSGTPSHILSMEKKSRDICALQTDIIRAAFPACVDDYFEERWKSIAKQERRKIVLEGLYNASCSDWLEGKRGLCPEFTLNILSAGDGSGYLRLLRTILPPEFTTKAITIKSPILIRHPKIDFIWTVSQAQREIPGLEAWVTDVLLDRAFFASMAIWCIFNAAYATSQQLTALQLSFRTSEERKQVNQRVLRTCQHHGKPEASLVSGELGKQLRACGRCLSAGREVYYCSRNCQVNNWNCRVPTPQQATCGQAPGSGTTHEARNVTNATDTKCHIPEPDIIFERPPDLDYQITFLRQRPHVDYTFMFPHPLPNRGVRIHPPQQRRTFLTLRDDALRTGDPEAVQLMYYILIPFADKADFSRQFLKVQLEREYCVELQELPITCSTVVASHAVISGDINKDGPDTHQLNEGVQLEDLHAAFPGALYAGNIGQVAPRTAADQVFCGGIYYALFVFASLGVMLLAIKFLLGHLILVFCVSPFLGNLFRALSGILRIAHDCAWHE